MMRGYTLAELVVAIAIAGIVAAIAVPLFNQPDIDATWFRDQVAAAVRYAQRQAVAQRRSIYVIVNTNLVAICYDSGPTCTMPVPRMETGAGYSLAAPAGVALTPASFGFDALGRPVPSAGASFTAGGEAITVNAETGYVQ